LFDLLSNWDVFERFVCLFRRLLQSSQVAIKIELRNTFAALSAGATERNSFKRYRSLLELSDNFESPQGAYFSDRRGDFDVSLPLGEIPQGKHMYNFNCCMYECRTSYKSPLLLASLKVCYTLVGSIVCGLKECAWCTEMRFLVARIWRQNFRLWIKTPWSWHFVTQNFVINSALLEVILTFSNCTIQRKNKKAYQTFSAKPFHKKIKNTMRYMCASHDCMHNWELKVLFLFLFSKFPNCWNYALLHGWSNSCTDRTSQFFSRTSNCWIYPTCWSAARKLCIPGMRTERPKAKFHGDQSRATKFECMETRTGMDQENSSFKDLFLFLENKCS